MQVGKLIKTSVEVVWCVYKLHEGFWSALLSNIKISEFVNSLLTVQEVMERKSLAYILIWRILGK